MKLRDCRASLSKHFICECHKVVNIQAIHRRLLGALGTCMMAVADLKMLKMSVRTFANCAASS